jgi:hypothetical protein
MKRIGFLYAMLIIAMLCAGKASAQSTATRRRGLVARDAKHTKHKTYTIKYRHGLQAPQARAGGKIIDFPFINSKKIKAQ